MKLAIVGALLLVVVAVGARPSVDSRSGAIGTSELLSLIGEIVESMEDENVDKTDDKSANPSRCQFVTVDW